MPYFGKPRCARYKQDRHLWIIIPSAIFLFAHSEMVHARFSGFHKFFDRWFSQKIVACIILATGPEIIKGVRASSINTLSTSSTMA
jgi:hypothetical protein